MFTGIIRSIGVVVAIEPHRLVIDAPGIDEQLGASISVDGCCLTVVESMEAPVQLSPEDGARPVPTRRYRFDLLPETIERTRLASLDHGDHVNLEPAVRAGEPLGGHLVQGHVDAVGSVRSVNADPGNRWHDVWIDVPDDLLRCSIERGSITINGISLTIMELDDRGVRVQLIPETLRRTNIGSCAVGGAVNVEADVIGRYVARMLGPSR